MYRRKLLRQHKIEITTTSVDGMWRKIVIIVIITVNVHQVSLFLILFVTLHLAILRSLPKNITPCHTFRPRNSITIAHRTNDGHTWFFVCCRCCRCCRLLPHFIFILLGNLVFRIYQFGSASVTLSLSLFEIHNNISIYTAAAAVAAVRRQGRRRKKTVINLANSNQESPPHTHIENPTR